MKKFVMESAAREGSALAFMVRSHFHHSQAHEAICDVGEMQMQAFSRLIHIFTFSHIFQSR